ncbi:MAG: hypothetical protein ACFE9I_00315 [Candidatus Hermodarchaeota archaeon]
MVERNHSLELRDKNFNDVQKIMENVLEKSFSLTTASKRLGSSLLRISYYDSKFENEPQKDNRITILQEPNNRVYIQIKGKLMDSQIGRLWDELEKNLNNSTYKPKIVKLLPSKEEIVQVIKDLIDSRGYIVKKEEVQTFIENFVKEYNRLPKKDEYDSIVKGYIIMTNERTSFDSNTTSIINSEYNNNLPEPYRESQSADKSLESSGSDVLPVKENIGRKKCPICGNDGLIHEMDDKSVILFNSSPKIFAKKNCCTQCGHEWRDH